MKSRSILLFLIIVVTLTLVCSCWVCVEKVGQMKGWDEAPLFGKNRTLLTGIGANPPIYFWQRPCFRPCSVFITTVNPEEFRLWKDDHWEFSWEEMQGHGNVYAATKLRRILPFEISNALKNSASTVIGAIVVDEEVIRVEFADSGVLVISIYPANSDND